MRYLTVYGTTVARDQAMLDYVYGTPGLHEAIKNDDTIDIVTGPEEDNYIIFGKILFNSGDLDTTIEDTYKEIDIGMLTYYRLDATAAMATHLPGFTHYMNGEWKIMTFMYPY